ncbi:hypothetical protein BGW38_004360 [Lunasporangiospora selenospora]|uniref:DUF6589 domain-containing protein n=1 Tax=Lunasporangiospora selenospora TaxID=979761 RepID=A0A9P6FQK9_9FUNG|nr:hypothetical protein BGW38_004360 [Lunasporangiospora selenospora]
MFNTPEFQKEALTPSAVSGTAQNSCSNFEPALFSGDTNYIITDDDKLRKVLDCMKECDFTLKTFLETACNSSDYEISRRMGMFGSRGGPASVLASWTKRFPDLKSDLKFRNAIVDFVSQSVEPELSKLRRLSQFRCSASSVTTKTINKVSLDLLSTKISVYAPLFCQLLSTFVGKTVKERSKKLVSVIASMIMYNRSQRSNYLQLIIGIHLFSTGCPSSIVTLLQRMALSTSRWSVKESLKSLTQEAIDKMKQAAAESPFALLYDNINMASKKHDQRLDNKDVFENGATATFIPNVNLGGIGNDPSASARLTIRDLELDSEQDTEYMSQIFKYHLINGLKKTCGHPLIESIIPPVTPLRVVKTQTFPLPSMKIDQSTLEGNLDILNKIVLGVLNLPEDYFDSHDIVILGDQLTVVRVDGLKEALAKDVTRYKRLEWAVPIIQLFHTQMMFAHLILRTHYGNEAVPGSLGFNRVLLERKRISVDKLVFHDVDEFLKHSFKAMVLRMWEATLGLDDGMDMEKMLQDISQDDLNMFIHTKAQELISTYLDAKSLNHQTNTTNYNAALFVRDMIFYIEFSAAIKVGDVGRIEQVLRWLTIITQAGSTSNYANELLKLQFGLQKHWSKERREAILQSWLINTKGTENGFIPADLYQEHCNKTIKEIYSSKGSNASWEMLATLVSTNIRTFDLVRSKIGEEFNIPKYDSRHQSVSATKDINAIIGVLRKQNVFSKSITPNTHDQITRTTDLISEGLKKLISGRLLTFNSSKVF